MGENVTLKLDEKKQILTATVDLTQDLGPSASGKTDLVAKCRENISGGVTVQLNVFKKKPKAKDAKADAKK